MNFTYTFASAVNFTHISWAGGLLCLALCGACQPPTTPTTLHAKTPLTEHGDAPQHEPAPQHDAAQTPQHDAVGDVSAEHAPSWAKDDVTDASSPWQLQLSEALVATLRNRSTTPQWALHGARLQPSELVVASEDGKRWPSQDERAVEKYDNTVYAESFEQVAPGATLPLFTLDVETTEAGARLEWGPFRIGSLPLGRYWLRIEWQSQVQAYFDPEKKRTRTLAGVWQGKLSSPWRQITLPR